MSDVHAAFDQGVELTVEWKDVDTLLVDQVVGYTFAADIARITLGRIEFKPMSLAPVGRPVVTIAASRVSLQLLHDHIGQVLAIMAQGVPSHDAEHGEPRI